MTFGIARASFDVETRSQCDIGRGNDVYLSHHTTELVCADMETPTFKVSAAFIPSCDGRDALEAKMRADGLNVVPPENLIAMVKMTRTIVAHNFAFEIGALAKLAATPLPPDRFSCTMARAMRLGLPGGLGNLASVLGFGDEGKDADGNRLMKQISKPRPTWSKWQHMSPEDRAKSKKRDAGPVWFEDAEKLARIAKYCADDVRVTRRIDAMLPELEPEERAIWLHVHDMNCRGVPVDVEMIHGAIAMSEEAISDVTDRIRTYSGGLIQSLKAPGQLVAWAERYGYYMPSWTKDTVAEALADPKCPEPVRVVALARQEASRGSVAKFEKAADMVSTDGTLKHQLLYAGTSTLRLAGRGVQPLNLPRPKIMADQSAAKADMEAGRPIRVATWKLDYDPERALAAIRAGDLAALRNMGDPEEILSDNLRAMICSPAGTKLASPDLSAIEARGVFWLVNCEKALDVIRKSDRGDGPDIYCQLASTMFGFPVIKKKHPEERQYGKVGVLQCGYGSGAARVAMANKIDEEMAYKIVQTYRGDYVEVPRGWRELENAAIEAIRHPGYMMDCLNGRVQFIFEAGWLRMRRPSGTWMYMPDAGVDFEGRLYYHAWIKGAWREESIWGGVIINFVVQGFCREVMFEAEMRLAADPRYDLFLQCYDSLTSAVPTADAQALCDNMIREMTTPPLWAPDFPLAAEGKPKDRYS